jgi:hypothetical protein
MRTRLVRVFAAIVIGLVVGPVALPGTSYAASDERNITSSLAGDNSFTAPLGNNWYIGDCTLYASMGSWYSYVRLTAPDSSGDATLTWGGVSMTGHTNNADIWWSTFTFATASGSTVFTSPQLRGLDMRKTFEIYEWSLTIPVHIDPARYFAITQVRWSSSC